MYIYHMYAVYIFPVYAVYIYTFTTCCFLSPSATRPCIQTDPGTSPLQDTPAGLTSRVKG